MTLMKTLITALMLMASSLSQAASLNVQVNDIEEPTGKLMIKLVNSKEAYEGKAKPSAGRMIEISNKGQLNVRFDDLAPGTYAIMIMHDENSNGKLDSNILGIPKECYGFSNNPRVMRQPTFEEAKFEVKEGDQAISINLI
jgi:uncharacterized protein (DUF2141 family)